ncbi:hypothetical protein J6590_014114, partial [Homalodisca vitripennis]
IFPLKIICKHNIKEKLARYIDIRLTPVCQIYTGQVEITHQYDLSRSIRNSNSFINIITNVR